MTGRWVVTCVAMGMAGASLAGQAVAPHEVCRAVEIPSGSLYACTSGSTGPTVVLEAGMRETHRAWDDVAPLLAESALVVRYDRAGSGASEPGSAPRTSDQIAAELAALLEAINAPGPFHLVGHSIGGWHVYALALRSDRVASVTMLDTPHPEFEARRRALLSDAERTERDRLLETSRSTLPEAIQLEYAGIEETRGEFTAEPIDVPLLVVSAGRHGWVPERSADAQERDWRELQDAWTDLGSPGSVVWMNELRHNLQREAPEAVAELILGHVRDVASP